MIIISTETVKREIRLAQYIIENNATVRQAASWSGISKSTVHTDITKKLLRTDNALYAQVRKILDENKAERHIRGGLATKEKWIVNKKTKK